MKRKLLILFVLAIPLFTFNALFAADITSAILKSEVTLSSTSGSTQSDRGMTFPMSAGALKTLGLLNDDLRNQQMCVEGSACPEADELPSQPTSWMQSIKDTFLVSTNENSNGYNQYYMNCQSANSGGTSYLSDCGGSGATQLFYQGSGNMAVGDEFWVIQQKQVFNAFEITIDVPWSQSGGGTLDCQWYYVPSGGTSSYTVLTGVDDPSECFSVPGTHTITWDLPTQQTTGFPWWASSAGTGWWFGFEITSAGSGVTIWPTGKDVKVERQEWATYAPTVSTAGTKYDLYVGGPAMKSESYFLPHVNGNPSGNTPAANMDFPANSWFNSPFTGTWNWRSGYSFEMEFYLDVTKLGGQAYEIASVGDVVKCYSNYGHFGCLDPMGELYGWGASYNCPGNATYGSGFNSFQAILTEGWHTVRWERSYGGTSITDNYCKMYIDGVLISTQGPQYYYEYNLTTSNNSAHRFGGYSNVEGIKRIQYNACWYDVATSTPSGSAWCYNDPYYISRYTYDFDFRDGWEGSTYIKAKNDHGNNGNVFYLDLYNLQNDEYNYYNNAYVSTLATADVGAFASLASGAGGGGGSTALAPADVITDLSPTGTFAGDTTIGAGLPGGDFLGSIAARDNLPVSFVWSIIAAGLVICTIAACMKYLKNILIASLAGGIVLAAFTVPAVGIFPIWVLFFYAIVATTTVVVTNKTGVF